MKIYSLESNDLDESANQFIPGQSHVQELWVNSLTCDLERVAAFDPRPVGTDTETKIIQKTYYNARQKSWSNSAESHLGAHVPEPPPVLSALEVASLDPGEAGFDFRPHLFDPKLNKFILVDSGASAPPFLLTLGIQK